MNDAAGTASSEGRRLRAERAAERIFEMSPALLAVAGYDGYLKRFNPAFAVFGYSREELLSRPWIEFAHPHDRERMAQAAAALERGADVVELHNRVVCRDGSLRWVEWKTRVVPEEGLFYAAGRDVTESRRAAEEQAALRRVATLVARETAPDAVFAAVVREVGELLGVDATHLGRFDEDGTVVSVAQWGSHVGVNIGDAFPLEGDSVSVRVLRSGRPARIDTYEEAHGTIAATIRGMGIRSAVGAPISVWGRTWGVMTATTKGEKPFPPETEARLQDFTELVATAISNATAITRRRRLEMDVAERSAELERSEAYLAEGQKLTRAGSVAFAVPNWEVTHSSAEHSRLYGFDPERGIPSLRDFRSRLHPEDRSIPGEALERGVRERRAVEAEFRVIVPDAGERRLLATAQPVFDASGEITEFVSTVLDVTERRQAESELERLAGEQAALRRVAMLVAREGSQAEVFEAIASECVQLFGAQEMRLVRFDESPGPSEFVVAGLGKSAEYLPVGSRQPLVGENMTSQVFRTGRLARIDDYPATASGPIGEALKAAGIQSIIGAPIMVEGRLWGAMGVGSRDGVLPPGSESRLGEFTELMATAIANAESHAREERLADEQAALRRVATLVAEDVPPRELFDAVAREVGTLLGADFSGLARFEEDAVIPIALWAAAGEHPPAPPSWPRQPGDPASAIAETGQPVRWEDWGLLPGPIAAFARDDLGVQSTVGCPIFVGGRLWGALGTHWKQPESLPADTESRIAQFTDLVGTAVANAEARAEVARLAREQAALRRVATVVAREASQAEVFAEIAEGVGLLLGAEEIRMLRYEDDQTALVVAASGAASEVMPVGSRQTLGGENAASRVLRTRGSARIDDYRTASGPIADAVRRAQIRGVVATPMLVEGRLWGTMVAATTRDEPLPPETESRLSQFTELMATAVANTESHARADRLADEQAALGTVATLVAEGVEPAELFSTVSKEVARLFAGVSALLVPSVIRFDPGPEFVLVGAAEPMLGVPMGSRWGLKDLYVSTRVFRTGRSARIDESDLAALGGPDAELLRRQGFLYQVGSPIVVEGHLWGAMTMNSKEALPPDTGERLEKFTELVATAIANAESRETLSELADEQAALRRVATLAAEGATPGAVFDAVAGEMERLLEADQVALNRFEPRDEIFVLAHRGLDVDRTPVGSLVSIEGESATAEVRRTGCPARMDNYESAEGALADLARATGVRSSVSAPIIVEGGLWGVITASWKSEQPPPPDTEERMAKFAALLDAVIANAEARGQIERLADEQAALRRVATLVAHESPAAEVFAAVAEEVGRLLGIEDTTIFRYESDSTATVVADRGERDVPMPTGSRVSLAGESATALVRRTGARPGSTTSRVRPDRLRITPATRASARP